MSEFSEIPQPNQEAPKEEVVASEKSEQQRFGSELFTIASSKLRETWMTIASNLEELKYNTKESLKEIKKIKNWANVAMVGLVLSIGSISPAEQQSSPNDTSDSTKVINPISPRSSIDQRDYDFKNIEPLKIPAVPIERTSVSTTQDTLSETVRKDVPSEKQFIKDPENLVTLLDQVEYSEVFQDLDSLSQAAYENPKNTKPELATGITNLVDDLVLKEFLKLRRSDNLDHIIDTIHQSAAKYHRGAEYLFIISDQESGVGANKDKATVNKNWVGYRDPTLPGNPFAKFKRWETSFDYLGMQLDNYDRIWPTDNIHNSDALHDLPGALSVYSPAFENPTEWRIKQAELLIEDWRKITFLQRKNIINQDEVGKLVRLSYDRVSQAMADKQEK